MEDDLNYFVRERGPQLFIEWKTKSVSFFVCFLFCVEGWCLPITRWLLTLPLPLTLKWPLAVQGRDSLRGAQIWLFLHVPYFGYICCLVLHCMFLYLPQPTKQNNLKQFCWVVILSVKKPPPPPPPHHHPGYHYN
jgi:hypothetical protein